MPYEPDRITVKIVPQDGMVCDEFLDLLQRRNMNPKLRIENLRRDKAVADVLRYCQIRWSAELTELGHPPLQLYSENVLIMDHSVEVAALCPQQCSSLRLTYAVPAVSGETIGSGIGRATDAGTVREAPDDISADSATCSDALDESADGIQDELPELPNLIARRCRNSRPEGVSSRPSASPVVRQGLPPSVQPSITSSDLPAWVAALESEDVFRELHARVMLDVHLICSICCTLSIPLFMMHASFSNICTLAFLMCAHFGATLYHRAAGNWNRAARFETLCLSTINLFYTASRAMEMLKVADKHNFIRQSTSAILFSGDRLFYGRLAFGYYGGSLISLPVWARLMHMAVQIGLFVGVTVWGYVLTEDFRWTESFVRVAMYVAAAQDLTPPSALQPHCNATAMLLPRHTACPPRRPPPPADRACADPSRGPRMRVRSPILCMPLVWVVCGPFAFFPWLQCHSAVADAPVWRVTCSQSTTSDWRSTGGWTGSHCGSRAAPLG